MSAPSDRPGSATASHESPKTGFRCAACTQALVWRGVSTGLSLRQPDGVWETPPLVPAGATSADCTSGWMCPGAECRRVYLLWDGVPNFLREEAGVLTAAAHARLREGDAVG